MKYLFLMMALLIASLSYGQHIFPYFLQGTWKMENKEVYEHWDKLGKQSMKGFSYQMEDGQMLISEYLDIVQKNHGIVYTATVINQNDGKGIEFKLTRSDSVFIFESPDHDFPKRIAYQRISDTDILVQVSDGEQKGFFYRMTKQNTIPAEKDTTIANPNYDKALSEKLGGDDYGMKRYFFVILKTGINTTQDKEFISESFKGHLNNIGNLVEEDKLVVAGPLGKNENNYRGIFILNNITSAEEADELLLTDPAIKNGLLDYEIYSWYGSAALPEYLPFSDKIWKLKF